MSADLIAEDEIRGALRPHRADPQRFAAGVRERMRIREVLAESDRLAGMSPTARAAASFLPLALFGKGGSAAGPPVFGAQKLVAGLAFPAISLFVLAGATIFGVRGIRSAGQQPVAPSATDTSDGERVRDWWLIHAWQAGLVYFATMGLMLVGATDLLFAFYILSIGLLVYAVRSLARVGLGNRQMIVRSCGMGLVLLGQLATFPAIGDSEIHFLPQRLVGALFMAGGLALIVSGMRRPLPGDTPLQRRAQKIALPFACLIAAHYLAWAAWPLLWPAPPARIIRYVESFDDAPFSTSSWSMWEIPTRWTIEQGLSPDLSAPRRLLATELAGKQNAFILGTAFRVGLIPPDEIATLRELTPMRESLLSDGNRDRAILSFEQHEWVIRALLLEGSLTPAERDRIAHRVRLTLDHALAGKYDALHDALLATQLLKLLGQPVDAAAYRERVHRLLLELHTTQGGGYHLAGGFRIAPDRTLLADDKATAYAVELMQIYGVPPELEINWVRSYLRPTDGHVANRWINAVTRRRLESLPGIEPLSGWTFLYHERNLLAAIAIIGLCAYAVVVSPWAAVPRKTEEDGETQRQTWPQS